MNNNFGYIKDFKTRDNFVLGGFTKIPKVVLQPNGQWDAYLPEREYQNINNVETYNCTSFATTSVIEMIMKRKYGLTVNYSDRASGINAGTYPPGNSPHKVSETIRDKGLLPEELLPFKDIKSVDEYYRPNPLPETLKQRCLLWVDRYTYQHEWVDAEDIKEALTYSPIGVAVYAWNEGSDGRYYKPQGREDNHWTVLYGYDDSIKCWKIYDSYDNTLKLYSYSSFIESAKRYHIEEKTIQVQNDNILKKFINFLQNYVKYLTNKPLKSIGEVIGATFSKREE